LLPCQNAILQEFISQPRNCFAKYDQETAKGLLKQNGLVPLQKSSLVRLRGRVFALAFAIGDKLRVKLVKTDIQRGYIDFVRDGARVDLRTAAPLPGKNMASGPDTRFRPHFITVPNWTDIRPEYRHYRAWIRWNAWRRYPLVE
jgi:hypothetical protein